MNEDELILKKYNNREFLRIVIDKELINKPIEFPQLVTNIQHNIRLVPLYGGNLGPEEKYEVMLLFNSEKITIDKMTKEIRVKK